MAGVSLVGSFMTFELATQLLNFGAFVGFILVNLSVIRHYYIRLGRRRGWDFVRYFLFPLLGALVCGYIWISLTNIAKLVGFGWLGLGLVYLAVITKGFRKAPQSLGTLTEGEADAN
jgi:amino acid transporter